MGAVANAGRPLSKGAATGRGSVAGKKSTPDAEAIRGSRGVLEATIYFSGLPASSPQFGYGNRPQIIVFDGKMDFGSCA